MYMNPHEMYHDTAWYCVPLALALQDTAYAELCLFFKV